MLNPGSIPHDIWVYLGNWEDGEIMEGSVDNLVLAFACHLVAVKAAGGSLNTIRLYAGRQKQFLTYLQQIGESPPFHLTSLDAAHVRRAAIWVRERSHGTQGGEHAARALVGILKTTSAWLADEGYIDVDLVARVRRPKASSTARTPFSQAEVRELVNAALDTRMANRDIAMIHVLLDTGVRVGGLVSILLPDLNLRDRRVELRLKGGNRHVLYFGSSERRDGGRTVRALKAWCNDRLEIAERWPERHKQHLFLGYDGWPLTEAGVRSVMERLSQRTGVQHVIPHRFRHTFASWYLVRHPGDETGLRGILGHLSDDMYRTYAHVAHEIIAERAGRMSLSEVWLSQDAS